jgi:hypothetical protein
VQGNEMQIAHHRLLVHKACQGYYILLDVALRLHHGVSLAIRHFAKELKLINKQLEYNMVRDRALDVGILYQVHMYQFMYDWFVWQG